MASDPTNIDKSRSPYAPNLISDSDGYPEKRVGYRTLAVVESPVNAIFFANIKGKDEFIIHGGTKLYKWTVGQIPTVIKSNINNAKSVGFVFKNIFYIFTGKEYLYYNGTEIKNVSETAKIPLHIIARSPSGGGKVYEHINLLQSKRQNSFLGDGKSREYCLSSKNIKAVNEIKIDDKVLAAEEYSVNLADGKVTFKTAPPNPKIVGHDNVLITFEYITKGYKERIENCTISTLYGYGNNDRVIISGNAAYKNYDWISELNDPTYFADTSYNIVGNESTAIMGYCKIGSSIAIIKESNAQDSTIFFRTAIQQDDKIIFTTKQSIVGIGMIAKNSVGTIDDEAVFLSERGVYAITKNNLTANDTVQNRSWFINNAIVEEDNLRDATVISHQNRYMISINGNVYLLDGNSKKVHTEKTNGDFIYECYQWDNIYARCFLSHQEVLYFGTHKGEVCRFNTDIHDMKRYSDNGMPIEASFTTMADDDGDFSKYKTLLKNGFTVKLKPYPRSSVSVYLQTDNKDKIKVDEKFMDIFDWADIDFSRFTFNGSNSPQVISIKTKCKNYITMQIIVSNAKVNEGFGILGITKNSIKGKFVR